MEVERRSGGGVDLGVGGGGGGGGGVLSLGGGGGVLSLGGEGGKIIGRKGWGSLRGLGVRKLSAGVVYPVSTGRDFAKIGKESDCGELVVFLGTSG